MMDMGLIPKVIIMCKLSGWHYQEFDTEWRKQNNKIIPDMKEIDKTFNLLKRIPVLQMYNLYTDLAITFDGSDKDWVLIRNKLLRDNGWTYKEFCKVYSNLFVTKK